MDVFECSTEHYMFRLRPSKKYQTIHIYTFADPYISKDTHVCPVLNSRRSSLCIVVVNMYVCIHVCKHVCMNVCMNVCMYACTHACMYVLEFACAHLRTEIQGGAGAK